MVFKIGTRVKFIHTGDEGVVRKLLEDDMILVYLESVQLEIPVFENDLEIIGELKEKANLSKDFIAKKQQKTTAIPQPSEVESGVKKEELIVGSIGLQLAFDPVLKQSGLPEKYDIYLLNDTQFEVIYHIDFFLEEAKEETWSGTISAGSAVKLDDLFYDELNDFPVFEVECWKISTEGKDRGIVKTLKIKPKIFFKNVKFASLLNKKVHWYLLIENFDNQVVRKVIDAENLADYTKSNVQRKDYHGSRQKIHYSNPIEYAEFNPVIDLHIQNLTSNHGKMTNAQIMQLQLQKFEEFIAKAVRLGVPQVFVIHGLGKGKLRDEIAKRLRSNSYVEDFKNEHHPKYGWGATEVIL